MHTDAIAHKSQYLGNPLVHVRWCISKQQRNYCVTQWKLLATGYFCTRWFHLQMYHASLAWLLSFHNLEGQLACWIEVLPEFNFKVQHHPRKLH